MPRSKPQKSSGPKKKPTSKSGGTPLGNAGEHHQKAGGKHPALTTNQGVPISDNQNSLRASERGPTLLEDFVLREKIMHFDHERIPERIVHARGTGVHGRFTLKKSLGRYTTAKLFTEVDVETPVFARISTVAGGAGSVDTPRDVRGFAVKFYTGEGNYDLVGNNVPVFFIQDAIKFPDLVHALKMEPDRAFPQAASAHDTFWDFISHTPEAMHMVMWQMSDRTIPRSLRMIEGFGVHSFRLINQSGKSTFVKFHWRPVLGLQSTVWDEAVKIAGADQDFHRRDMFEAILRGDFPAWDLAVQLFTEEEAEGFPFDHLDPTKIVPEEMVPLKVIGRMVLDRWPDNFFAETEQVAFCPANIVPGIDFSNDPLLQGRLFSYLDTQLSRLGGPNFHQIPINAPRAGVANNQRDGHMQMGVPTGRVAYEPQSLEPDKPRETDAGFRSCAQPTEDGSKGRIRAESFADHYSQARQFYRSQSPVEQAHMASALIFELSKVQTAHVREAMVAHVRNIDQDLAKRVAKGLSIDPLPTAPKPAVPVQDLPKSPATTLIPRMKETLEGRAVGILVAEGSDEGTVDSIRTAAEDAGAAVTVVAPTIGKLKTAGRKTLNADAQLAGSPSVFYDAVAVVLSESGGTMLAGEAAAKAFVADAFSHLKAIAADGGAQALLDAAGVMPDAGVVAASDTKAFIKAAKTRQWAREPEVRSKT
ncbi:MAG: catalase [Coriobacteriia bacterium]|nr:catalase [Coriobacteriia bacterium]